MSVCWEVSPMQLKVLMLLLVQSKMVQQQHGNTGKYNKGTSKKHN
jgi:hypothetical protein